MKVLSGYLSIFCSGERERQEIVEVRKAILNKVLYLFSLLGLPAVVIGAAQAFQQGRPLFSVIYFVLYVLFLLGVFVTRRLSYRIRALIPVLSLFVFALAILLRIGMSGVGFQLMIGMCFLVALLFGVRAGVLAVLVSLLSMGVVATGMKTGFIKIYPEQMLTSHSPQAWIIALIVFFTIMIFMLFVSRVFTRRIEESLDLLEENKRELEAANEHLREASMIISRSRSMTFLWSNREGWPVEYVSDNVENVLGYTAEEFLTGPIL